MQNITNEFDEFEPEFEDYTDVHLDFDEEEDHSGQVLDEDYDDEELERRRAAYSDLKKNDKIFNNTYTMGYETPEDDEELSVSQANVNEIKLDSSSLDYNLYDPEKYADHIDLLIVRRDIDNFIQSNDSVLEILGNEPEKKKFTKSEINMMFEIIYIGLSRGDTVNIFISPIHVLDSLSSTVNMEYKKIFDMLTYNNKEILLLELNSKYGFLDSMGKNFKMF